MAAAALRLDPPLCWHVVRSYRGQERIAKAHLERKSYGRDGQEVYLPQYLATDGRRQDELVARPFFPTFLFVRTWASPEYWRPLFSTVGVKSVMLSGEHPAMLKDKVIADIKAEENDGFVQFMAPEDVPCRFVKGQKVEEARGLKAVFMERVDANRVAILVSLFGRDSVHLVPLSSIR